MIKASLIIFGKVYTKQVYAFPSLNPTIYYATFNRHEYDDAQDAKLVYSCNIAYNIPQMLI